MIQGVSEESGKNEDLFRISKWQKSTPTIWKLPDNNYGEILTSMSIEAMKQRVEIFD